MHKIFWNMLLKWKTKNFTKIPMVYIMFDWEKFRQCEPGSCDIATHPKFDEDKVLIEKLIDCVDYIRDNYDMETFTRI